NLVAREVLVAIVGRLELRTVNGNACRREQAHLPAQLDKPHAHLPDCRTVVLAEIRDRLVVRGETPEQPDHFETATRFAFKAAARSNAVEVAVDEEPEQDR